MDKDEIKGKMKDIEGRIQRQAGEWTGSTEDQAKGLGKQVEGKVQNAIGSLKDESKKAMDKDDVETDKQDHRENKDEEAA